MQRGYCDRVTFGVFHTVLGRIREASGIYGINAALKLRLIMLSMDKVINYQTLIKEKDPPATAGGTDLFYVWNCWLGKSKF